MISFYQAEGFRFFFSNQETEAPAHVHMIGRGGQIIIWLDQVEAALNHNLSQENQCDALRVVAENIEMLRARWFEWQESYSRIAA